MSLSRIELSKKLNGVENAEEIIDYVMSEHGKALNSVKTESEDVRTKLLEANKNLAAKENELKEAQTKIANLEQVQNENTTLKEKVQGFETEKKNAEYLEALSGVNEKFKKFVFAENKPNENESVEDYKKRINTWLDSNQEFKQESFKKTSTAFNIGDGETVDFDKMSDKEYAEYYEKLNKK